MVYFQLKFAIQPVLQMQPEHGLMDQNWITLLFCQKFGNHGVLRCDRK